MATYAQLFDPALSGLQFDGVALASGVIYFYEPGTTTLRTVYTNRTKTVTAANPYTLDSNGQAEIFLDGVYDVVVKTAVGGTTKATWENVERGFTLDGFTASSTPTANQIVALNSSSEMSLPNAVHKIDGNKIWHAGNDGAASGLDSDKLDGQEGAYYAPIASPTFTGVPAAPTATTGTNTTQLATTAFVQTEKIATFGLVTPSVVVDYSVTEPSSVTADFNVNLPSIPAAARAVILSGWLAYGGSIPGVSNFGIHSLQSGVYVPVLVARKDDSSMSQAGTIIIKTSAANTIVLNHGSDTDAAGSPASDYRYKLFVIGYFL